MGACDYPHKRPTCGVALFRLHLFKTEPSTIGILTSHLHKREVLPMSTQQIPPPFALFAMVTGYYVSRAIYVVANWASPIA